MTKSLTKFWLGGVKRMLHLPNARTPKSAAPESVLMAAQKMAADWPFDDSISTAAAVAMPVEPAPPVARESRVRPRAAAWAAGEWTRADHPLPPAFGRFVKHLEYGLYVPPGADTDGLPLLVMLHGCKQDMDQFAQGTRMNLLADRHGFAVIYPEQSLNAHAHGCWHWYDDTARGGRGEAQAVVALVDTLVTERGFDASRVYAAGLSAGAGLVSLLSLHFPQRFAAVALHSGPAFGDAHSGITAMDVMRRGLHRHPAVVTDALVAPGSHPGMPALIVHGDDDRVVAPKNADELAVQFLRLNGLANAEGEPAAVERVETSAADARTIDYRRDGESVVRLCRVHGLAHAWAGGDDSVPFHSAAGPDASELIWSFFASRTRAVVAS
ncbi:MULTISPECIES: extracellular catalytic domain type 1 short-chain-length polyhydroxyalkanoate depolymerase [Burkholderia]|uniref:extracellular catalytic domain type 1 short-chain-length polyhydroxyalkanoate depolymerase n=1 Tax=Burkholderia TaxID=32008 RepID=UPI00075251D2|nr:MULTISPECIES: PHB depolymerase family esterase [Burkholderia]AOJ73076.1 esterase [Burkholderia savannae]KVG47006.1 esterase [Burkholderia sp. MSMB0265]KVG85286.1 esterase [Burkholderia sp. MSMB2040]KVG91080.1 esterase [Burkholderia sp. MSMB2041]KVG95194.1 esterase [Burkholderia sp. MSMB2042]